MQEATIFIKESPPSGYIGPLPGGSYDTSMAVNGEPSLDYS